MLGAIAGDVIGSVYEHHPIRSTEFPLFGEGSRATDDTVLTVATADVLLHGGDYAEAYRRYCRRFPDAGYGPRFARWARADRAEPYHSYGNGSAMRVSPVGWARDTARAVLAEARRSAAVTHDHPEGVKGAQATALAVFMARTGASKEAIRSALEGRFGYDLTTPLDARRADYRFDVTCQGSVPPALCAFLEADHFEHAVRLAISLGGDADTQACIAGAVAEAHYGEVPPGIRDAVLARLSPELVAIVAAFRDRYGPG